MKSSLYALAFLLMASTNASAQSSKFDRFSALLGTWHGTGDQRGRKSKITSRFSVTLQGSFISVTNDSRFEPEKPGAQGEHHQDHGFISFDTARKAFVFRQFHGEGFVNQYTLNEDLSSGSVFVFESEAIENFVPGGKARWTIRLNRPNEIETIFDLSMPGKPFACFGRNVLVRDASSSK